jgi:hypothetical protein
VCARPELRGSPARARAAGAAARADVLDRADGAALVRVAERVAVRVLVTRT